MAIELQITSAKGQRTFTHAGPTVQIGRDPAATLPLEDDAVSWQHARIDLTPQGATLSDTGSRNGTLLNHREVSGPAPLHAGDQVQLGYSGPSLTVVALEFAASPVPGRRRPAVLAAATPAGLLLLAGGWWTLRGERRPMSEPASPQTERAEAQVEKQDAAPAPAFPPQPKPAEPIVSPEKPVLPSIEAKPVKFVSAGNEPTLLFQKTAPETAWQRLEAGSPDVFPTARLVALPGFQGDILVGNGLRLRLWGIVPEQVFLPTPVRESVVELHSSGSADVDMTLHRGRVLLTGPRGRTSVARVRLQPLDAAAGWEIRLEAGAEILLERWGSPSTGHVLIRRGKVRVQTPERTLELRGPPGDCYFQWLNMAPGPAIEKLKEIPSWADDAPELPLNVGTKQRQTYETAQQAVNSARVPLAAALGSSVPLSLRTALSASAPNVRALAVRGLGAIDDLAGLAAALENANGDVRRAAIETLRIWSTHAAAGESQLRAALTTAFAAPEAALVYALLSDISAQEAARKDTYSVLIGHLTHPRLAIRELAAWQLYLALPTKAGIQAAPSIAYSPDGTPASQQAAQQAWLRLLQEGTLPPQSSKKSTSR
jgi:hypothetical protein